ncbi:MAG: hypothetical protein ACE5JP_03620 [Candidatus Bipolaricaulia bacterium]
MDEGKGKGQSRNEGHIRFLDLILDLSIALLLALGILVSLAVLLSPSLQDQADPLHRFEDATPPWYLLAVHQLFVYLPHGLGIVVGILAIVLLFLWPFLDRNPERHPKKRPVAITLGLVAVSLMVLFSILGYFEGGGR